MTLIELLVAVALLGTVLAAVLTFTETGGSFWERGAALAEAHQHLRVAVEELVHELQYAYGVHVDADTSVITYRKKVNGEFKLYQVYLAGKQLLLNLPEGTAVPLAGCIDSFSAEPGGLLEDGEELTLKVYASYDGYPVELQSRIIPRNVGGGL